MTAGFTALVHLPLTEATAISFARTLFTTILAIVFLHEVVGRRRWSATLVGFLGVVIVARPSPGHLSEYALLALLSAAFVAALQIALRSPARTARPRPDKRRVGKEGSSTCRSRGAPHNYKKTKKNN